MCSQLQAARSHFIDQAASTLRDLQVSDLLVEAKLTESGFQQKRKSVLESYFDFAEAFGDSLIKFRFVAAPVRERDTGALISSLEHLPTPV
jgi:hypothetical protein